MRGGGHLSELTIFFIFLGHIWFRNRIKVVHKNCKCLIQLLKTLKNVATKKLIKILKVQESYISKKKRNITSLVN